MPPQFYGDGMFIGMLEGTTLTISYYTYNVLMEQLEEAASTTKTLTTELNKLNKFTWVNVDADGVLYKAWAANSIVKLSYNSGTSAIDETAVTFDVNSIDVGTYSDLSTLQVAQVRRDP